MRSLLLAAVLLMTAAAACAADGPAEFGLEEFLQVPVLTAPRVSPSGAHVAYLERWRDIEKDEDRRRIHLVSVERGESRRITFDDGVSGGIAWRPDGALSYLAKRGDDVQVWINPLDGTEPRAVTAVEGGVHDYWWAPDGGRMVVLATPPEAEQEDDDERADWIVHDRLEHPEQYAQLWLVEVGVDGPSEADPRRLTAAPLHPYHVAWSPDGATLAVTYNELFSSLVDEEQRIGLLDLASGELKRISDPDRHASLAAFSPDGRRLAWFQDRSDELRAYLNLKDLVVQDLKRGEIRVLTGGVQACLSGFGSTPADAPLWSLDGSWIYLRVAEGRDMDVRRVDTARGTMETVVRSSGNVTELDLAGGVLAWAESELHRPGSIRAAPARSTRKARELATADGAVADYELAAPRRLELPGHDGVTVEGFLFLPPGKDLDDGPFPFVMEMHGGPYSRYGNAWTTRYPWQVLSRRGYAVFIANPRGGTAYGEEFLRGVYRNFGTDDYLDLMAACDALVERGIADPDRMGFTGYSYGGLSTDNVITRTDRFKAAVSVAGIFNYVSAMGQNNPQLFIDSYDQPWAGDLQRLWEHSPASRIADAVTPTLIMHGTDDEPVDPRQSIEMFSYLQMNGVPSRLVLYPGEGHGINRPSHMMDYQSRELEWFDHYLLGDETASGANDPVPDQIDVVDPPRKGRTISSKRRNGAIMSSSTQLPTPGGIR